MSETLQMNANGKNLPILDEATARALFSMGKTIGDAGFFHYDPAIKAPTEDEGTEISQLRAKLRQEKRNRRVMELRNRFHGKIEEILSGLDKVSDIRNLFDYLLYEAPKILGCEARFHFVGLGPFFKNDRRERRTELFDDLSEIFKTSLVAYLSVCGNAGGRINAHSGNAFDQNPEMEYIPIVLENYRTDPGAKGRDHARTEPFHTGTRTIIGYVEAPKRSNERRSFEPEAAAKKIMRSLRTHLEEISTGLLMEVHKRNACLDPLTEVLNRRGFFETVEKMRRGSADLATERGGTENVPSKSSVITLDLDHFKSVNDRHGHEMGDRALKYVAQTVSQVLERVEGACVGRF
jgi:GGDEF domain-containing protein